MYLHHILTFFTWQGNNFFAYFNRTDNELQMYQFVVNLNHYLKHYRHFQMLNCIFFEFEKLIQNVL